jgi:uncharacterized iron-regulated membrane protein
MSRQTAPNLATPPNEAERRRSGALQCSRILGQDGRWMSRHDMRILLTLHGWAGIVTGVLLFIVCFSGAVIVFKDPIDAWANPALSALPRGVTPASVDVIAASAQGFAPNASIEMIWPPDTHWSSWRVFVRERETGLRRKLVVNDATQQAAGWVDSQLGQLLRSLHVFLFFGPRWIVGFLGVAMLVLIGTGFFLHQKILRELFTQRFDRSLRLLLSDGHKALAIWGLGFHLLIALTGAWLGLKPVVVGAWDGLRVAPALPVPDPMRAPPQSLDALLREAERALPALDARYLTLTRFGFADATLTVSGRLNDSVLSGARVVVDADRAAVIEVFDPRAAPLIGQLDALMEPLHFGDFGGLTLQWLYFLLGMTPALLSLTGTLLWLDKRGETAA